MTGSNTLHERPAFVFYLAVLPAYRAEALQLLREELGSRLQLIASPAHLERSVKTGLVSSDYLSVPMLRLFGKAFVQYGAARLAFGAETAVVDLNPRSITAWLFLMCRRLLGKRTLVWGHISPQAGSGAPTARLRRLMRRFAAGTISYTYSDRLKAISEVPGQPVWVAANSLYRADRIRPASSDRPRTDIVYVGRFERAKKVELLIEGYAIFAATCPEARLVLAGDGGQLPALRGKVRDLGLGERVVFAGWISDYKALKEVYSTAVCSASPGFAGLGLTQSLGFGVPCVVADSEPHSPEIELATEDSVIWFESNDAADLGRALALAWRDRGELPREDLSADIAERYSAEAMARGLSGALRNTDPESASTERAPRER